MVKGVASNPLFQIFLDPALNIIVTVTVDVAIYFISVKYQMKRTSKFKAL